MPRIDTPAGLDPDPRGRSSRHEPQEPPADGCALCSAARRGATTPLSTTSLVVAYVDDTILALVEPGSPDVLLAPRAHADGLTTEPRDAGLLLAALRRAADVVASTMEAPGSTLEPVNELTGALGHACYRVRPAASGAPPSAPPPRSVDVERLAAALGRSGTTLKSADRPRRAASPG